MNHDAEREAMRQQALMAALCHDVELPELSPWLRADAAGASRADRGLLAYRANAGALAERALAAAYPVVQQLLGTQSFAALARALWHDQAPHRGDLAQFGAGLPVFIEASAQLAEEPYLADCARVDWALHQCEQAEDAPAAAQGLELLGSEDPQLLFFQLRPGTVVLSSGYPVVSIWQAHQGTAADRFEPVRAALANEQAERALVWRQGWRAQAAQLSDAEAAFTSAVLLQQPLSQAFDAAGASLDFEVWLTRALQLGWLVGVSRTMAPV